MPVRRVRSKRSVLADGKAPTVPPEEVKRTGREGRRGSAIASRIIEGSGSSTSVPGVMTPTGRKPARLVPPVQIEIGRHTTDAGGPAPHVDHIHGVHRPKDVFVDHDTSKRKTKKR